MIITLTGPNEFLIKQTLDELTANFEHEFGVHAVERLNGDDIDVTRMAELLQGASLFAARRLVIIKDMSKNKALWDALADWLDRVPEETTLAIIESAPDKRTKTYKLLQKQSDLRVFEQLSEQELVAWLGQSATDQQGSITADVTQYLIQRVGVDQWRLYNELQKLLNSNLPINKDAVDILVEASPQATAFELLDAALGCRPQKVRELISFISVAEDPYRFFGLLVSQIYALSAVFYASGKNADVIAKDADLHPFVVRKTQNLARTITEDVLKQIVANVVLCDDQLKSTGAEPWLLIEQCLSKIASR